MATSNAAVRSALLSVQGLRRRRLGHIGPNHYPQNHLDKWGRKNGSGSSDTNLIFGGTGGHHRNNTRNGGEGERTRPPPRASLILGGAPSNRGRPAIRRNGSENGILPPAKKTNGIRVGGGPARVTNNSNGVVDKAAARSSSHSSDLVVVLDMDECLVHSQFLSDQRTAQHQQCQQQPPKEKYRQIEDRPSLLGQDGDEYSNSPFGHTDEAESIVSTACESFRVSLPDGDLVHINKRPNLDIFLREITSKFETYVFTAAMEVYAAPVLNKLDPTGDMFRGRFYRQHCIYDPNLGVYAKDLCDVMRNRTTKILASAGGDGDDRSPITTTTHEEDALSSHFGSNDAPCDERRVVLVDNNPLSFLPNPSNGILVSSFYDDPKDDTLEAVMELLEELDGSDDVRPILNDKFGLKDALRDVTKGGVETPGGWR